MYMGLIVPIHTVDSHPSHVVGDTEDAQAFG